MHSWLVELMVKVILVLLAALRQVDHLQEVFVCVQFIH